MNNPAAHFDPDITLPLVNKWGQVVWVWLVRVPEHTIRPIMGLHKDHDKTEFYGKNMILIGIANNTPWFDKTDVIVYK